MKFHTVIIIFNPNSTGPSRNNAELFEAELIEAGFDGEVKLIGTKFAGHAEEITAEHAYEEATLIVSSSGDGGYNEVVNGLLSNNGKATVAVLASGNANDHAVSVGSENLTANIVKGNTKLIDTMLVSSMIDNKPWKRYAHSYVGFGLTPAVGRLLTEKRPNVLTEKWYVLRHIFSFKHVTLKIEGKRQRLANLVMAIIPKMSKVIRLDEDASVHDGKMEVYKTKYVSRFKLIFTLLGIGLQGVSSEESTNEFNIRTIRSTLIQLDGEVTRLPADVEVAIQCKKSMLKTIA